MSERKRKSAATATVGLVGVGGAAALRHAALVDAYGEKTARPVKRPRFAAERRMISRRPGRGKWLTGAAIGTLSIPPAAVGVNGLINKIDHRRGFFSEGLKGARDSIVQRNETMAEKPPARLAAGNYLAGAGVGSAAGGLTHMSLNRTRFPGSSRSAAAAIAGVVAGSATLPLQSKLTQRASHGKYEVTPVGVRRRRTKPVRPSTKAGKEITKMVIPVHGPSVRAGYLKPGVKSGGSKIGARMGARWATGLTHLADAAEGAPPPAQARKTRRLVATGRSKASGGLRSVAIDATPLNAIPESLLSNAVGKADDPGATLTRNQRRLRFTASSGAPVVGDVTSAVQAARLAPPGLRGRTAAQQYGANVGSAAAGNVVGGVGAAALAARYKGFDRRANQASDAIDGAKNHVRSAVGLKPTAPGPGRVARALASDRVPKGARTAARLVASRPKVAAVGALAGGLVAGNAGSQAAYGAIMTRDDKHRARNPNVRHGKGKFAKNDAARPLSEREKKQLGRRKKHSAAMSVVTGTTGLSALGATVGEKTLRHSHPQIAGHLGRYSVPALTFGAGVGGLNSFTGAAIQRKEARQAVTKGLVPGLVSTGRRAPSIRSGYTRQTRTATGMKVSTVRGGLMR